MCCGGAVGELLVLVLVFLVRVLLVLPQGWCLPTGPRR